MGNIFFSIKFNRILLCGTLIAFSLTSIPFPCYSQTNVGVNELAFAFRIEQLLEKVKKAVDKKDSNKLIDLMFDVKREVEAYSGTSIDLDKQLNAVEAEIKKKGAPSLIIWPPGERWGIPNQRPYPLFNLPRLAVWGVVALIALAWFLYRQRNKGKPIFNKL